MGMHERVSYPVNVPSRDGRSQPSKGGVAADRPAGGRANLSGPTGVHGTGLYHHVGAL